MLQFLPQPGPRERQLQRKANNPLFSTTGPINQTDVEQARLQDQKDLEEFLVAFRAIVEEAAALDARADADDILAIKARLEQIYPRACGVTGDNSGLKTALKKLLDIISQALLNAADNDPEAISRINEDKESSELHLRISEFPLVADLLSEKDIIPAEELPAILLGESEDAVAAALLLFNPEQLQHIIDMAGKIIGKQADAINKYPDILNRLEQLRHWHLELTQQ